MSQAQRDALDALYAQLPQMACRGLCEESCGPIGASREEVARIAERGVDVLAPRTELTCPALQTTFGPGRCRVYDVRPMVCRLWGMTAAMACPHGCEPVGGLLSEEQARDLLHASLDLGGHDDRRVRALMRALGLHG